MLFLYVLATEEECGCLLRPCINGGLCISEADTFVCVCERPFKGPKCEEIGRSCVLHSREGIILR